MKQIRFNDKRIGEILTEMGSVKNVVLSDRSLCFTTEDGCFVRVSYEGVNGWRVQANASGYSDFDVIGAAQSLSFFLDEEVKDASLPIDIKTEGDGIVLTANGETALVSTDSMFSIKFFSKSGVCTAEAYGLILSGNKGKVLGRLSDGEAVYGGGESFDSVNKRGCSMDLYTCDGWNNAKTTYIALPVFFTTKGGGFFFNRYETSHVDFGKTDPDVWSYSVNGSVVDCYFYATERAEEVLLGYTELSGHASLPTPWMQGVQVCRYYPDLGRFEKDVSFTSLETLPEIGELYAEIGYKTYALYNELTEEQKKKAVCYFLKNGDRYDLKYVKSDSGLFFPRGPKGNPGGDSVKTIMGRYADAGMKPDAASMEGFRWELSFADSDAGRERKDEFTRCVSWLHENGIRAMVYTGVGTVAKETAGLKEEYLLHADVTYKNADGTFTEDKNTVKIPWILGTGENPDVGKTRDGAMRTCSYLDITNKEAVDWFFNTVWGEMIGIGVDGIKIDFCEEMPSDGESYGGTVTHYRFADPDRIVKGTEHHAYPTYFISAFCKRMNELKAAKGLDDGFMVFSRGGGIGSQRSPYMWAGDQGRKMEKLAHQLTGVLNSGLSGLPFLSYDMAGYDYAENRYYTIGRERESEIFARAIEFTAFTSNIQTHGDVRHAYEMTDEVQQIYRAYVGLHTELLPYIQKYSRIAAETGVPPVRHLVLKYIGDTRVHSLTDEFMLGDALLVAPILSENTFEREVYLPKGRWLDLLSGETVTGGKTVTVKASLSEIPLFLDTESEDFAELKAIFDGENFKRIRK